MAILHGLLSCPIGEDRAIHNIWNGLNRNDVSLTTLLDFANITDPKDCESLTVIGQAGAGFREFLAATFGDHLCHTIGKDVVDALNNSRLEEITKKHPLFLVRAISRALVSLWNYLRDVHLGPDGKALDLSGDGYKPYWKAELERLMQADALTMFKFSQEMEGAFRTQVRARVRARAAKKGSKAAAAADEDTGSDGGQPKRKKAKKVAAVATPVSTKPAKASAGGSRGASGICYGALAAECLYGGFDHCVRGAGCRFSHDFSALSLSHRG